jgi:5-methylthioadenosine/S-adenosylhomocysteine deaminase
MATIEGAKAVHLEKEIGSLESGKKADIILINLDEPNAVPMYDVYSQLAYALKGSDVESVIIGGRFVMRDHQHLTLRESEILAKAQEYGKKVQASLK